MEAFKEIWNGPARYVIILMAVIIIAYIPIMIIVLNKKKRQANAFLAQNPTAARVVMRATSQGLISVLSVNGEKPNTFIMGTKKGFFLMPGENTVELTFRWVSQGVMHNTITHTVGPEKVVMIAETQKVYDIKYNRDTSNYDLTEAK